MKILKALLFWPSVWVFTIYKASQLILIGLYYQIMGLKNKEDRCHEIGLEWGTGILRYTPGWEYTVKGLEHIPDLTKKPVVIVANHQSSVDILALYTLGVQFRWLSKAEVFRLPFVGQAMTMCGYIPIIRGSKGSHNSAYEASRKCIENGTSMVYFPEGSRSKDGALQEFKLGAFRLADEENVQVLPVSILGTNRIMAKNSMIPNNAKIKIKVSAPLSRLENESLEDFSLRVRSQINEDIEKDRALNHQQAPVFETVAT